MHPLRKKLKTIKILHGDATKLDLPDESVDLIITHPPYFGIDVERYGGERTGQINSSFNAKKTLKLLTKAGKEMYRVLKPNGNLIIANGPTQNIDFRFVIKAVDEIGFNYYDYVVQNFYDSKTESKSEKITNSHTIWFHFAKGISPYNNPYKVKKYNNSIWDIPFNNEDDPIDVELSKDFHTLDVMHKEIPKRFIDMFSMPGHVVLDPFGGSGLVAITAYEMGRSGITNDISEKQVEAAKQRLKLTTGE